MTVLSPARRRALRRNLTGYCFLLPFLIPFALLFVWPIVLGFYVSLTNTNLVTGKDAFIGLANFRALLQDDVFVSSVGHTLEFVAESVPILVGVALLLALLLNVPLPGTAFLRGSIVAPYLLTGSAAALIWRFLLSPQGGLVNHWLEQAGLPRQAWLTTEGQAMPAIVLITLWWRIGFPFLVLLAGLQDIPQELYEAATIDGAGAWGRFRSITLPLLWPVLSFCVIIRMIDSFKVFPQTYLVTRGGPQGTTRVIIQYLYESGFEYYKIGYAAAIGYVFFLMVLAVTLVELKFFRTQSAYE